MPKHARMINSNLRLVVTIAREYISLGVPLLDLISEGNIGLTKAVERFDPAKGAKLSTYAMWWIKQSIKRALTTARRFGFRSISVTSWRKCVGWCCK